MIQSVSYLMPKKLPNYCCCCRQAFSFKNCVYRDPWQYKIIKCFFVCGSFYIFFSFVVLTSYLYLSILFFHSISLFLSFFHLIHISFFHLIHICLLFSISITLVLYCPKISIFPVLQLCLFSYWYLFTMFLFLYKTCFSLYMCIISYRKNVESVGV